MNGFARGREAGTQEVVDALHEFLPQWNYPPHVVAAICLEIKARTGGPGANRGRVRRWLNDMERRLLP